MTDRGTARHRAPSRATTPLTTFSSSLTRTVGDRAEVFGRSGAAIAMSSGLVASIALPANATAQQAVFPPRSPQTASLPVSLPGSLPAVPAALPPSGLAASLAGDALTRGALRAEREAARKVVAQQAAGVVMPTSVSRGGQVSAPAKPAQPAQSTDAEQAVAKLSAARRAAAKLAEAQRLARAAAAKKAAAKKAAAKKAAELAAKQTAQSDTATKPATVVAGARGSAVVSLAARYIGIPYRYGGSSPRGFDCSGLVQYVYKQAGISLPRTAQAQLNATTPIPASQARPGDLVFYVSGGYAYHNGIVTGPGRMIDSPRTGKAIKERAMFAGTKVYRRVAR